MANVGVGLRGEWRWDLRGALHTRVSNKDERGAARVS